MTDLTYSQYLAMFNDAALEARKRGLVTNPQRRDDLAREFQQWKGISDAVRGFFRDITDRMEGTIAAYNSCSRINGLITEVAITSVEPSFFGLEIQGLMGPVACASEAELRLVDRRDGKAISSIVLFPDRDENDPQRTWSYSEPGVHSLTITKDSTPEQLAETLESVKDTWTKALTNHLRYLAA